MNQIGSGRILTPTFRTNSLLTLPTPGPTVVGEVTNHFIIVLFLLIIHITVYFNHMDHKIIKLPNDEPKLSVITTQIQIIIKNATLKPDVIFSFTEILECGKNESSSKYCVIITKF